MQINVEKFLAMTALLAVGTAVGCSSDSKNSNGGPSTTTDSGAGGSSGSNNGGSGNKGGSAGKGGTTSDAGTGGKGGSGGTKDGGSGGSTGGKDGGGAECLGDDPLAIPDGGGEGYDPCVVIPYYNDYCYADSGVEGTPLGISVCEAALSSLRPGVTGALIGCLSAITDKPCSDTGRSKVLDCIDVITSHACEKPKMDGGTDPCASIKNCGEVTPATCHASLQAFTDDTVSSTIVPCLESSLAADAGVEGCQAAFLGCLPLGIAP